MALPQFVNDILSVGTWKRGHVRAPHKPLLLLLALSQAQSGNQRLVSYEEMEPRLQGLLLDFGPPTKQVRAYYPFWRLQNDGDFWEIPERAEAIAENQSRVQRGDIPPAILKSVNAYGGFTDEVFRFFRKNTDALDETVAKLLDAHFPPSMHDAILDAIGLERVTTTTEGKKRSATFREDILRLYGRRCAICLFDGRLGVGDLALEGAHVMWHACGGPDEATNGLLLCTFHHKLLDRGAIGISRERTVLVSQHVSGGEQVREWIRRFAGTQIALPVDPSAHIQTKYISWHRTQVFRDPPLPQ